jgi:hypothetical protein
MVLLFKKIQKHKLINLKSNKRKMLKCKRQLQIHLKFKTKLHQPKIQHLPRLNKPKQIQLIKLLKLKQRQYHHHQYKFQKNNLNNRRKISTKIKALENKIQNKLFLFRHQKNQA